MIPSLPKSVPCILYLKQSNNSLLCKILHDTVWIIGYQSTLKLVLSFVILGRTQYFCVLIFTTHTCTRKVIGTQQPPSQALAKLPVARRWILASNLVQTAHVKVSMNDGSCTIRHTAEPVTLQMVPPDCPWRIKLSPQTAHGALSCPPRPCKALWAVPLGHFKVPCAVSFSGSCPHPPH